MFKSLFFAVIMIILLCSVLAEMQINEIMANPSCSESYCEYIELYNNGTGAINMTNWKVNDSNDEDTFESFNGNDILIPGNSFALIVDSDSRVYSNFQVGNITWIYVDDTAIGGSGLSNSGEDINLKDENNNIIDFVSYNNSIDGESYSLINGIWVNAEPSPGKDNIENVSYAPDYSFVSISEFLPDPAGEDDQAMELGEWVELYSSAEYDIDLIGFYLQDNVGDGTDVYITNTTTIDGTIIKSKDYLIVYMNGVSGFLNNNGYDKINLYDLNGNLIDSVSYEGSDEGVSWSLTDGEWEKSAPTLGSGNLDNSSSAQSEIRIDEIYDLGDGKAEWGDIIRAELFVYKGNTEKYTVWIWIEDSSGNRATKKSKFSINEKFQNYTFTYPIFIPENCDDEFTSGNGKIIVEGLDERDEKILEIREKPLCKDGIKTVRVKDFEYELVEFPQEINDNDEFDLKLKLKSNNEDVNAEVSSYVFSGKKQYSNDNKKFIELKQGEEKIIELKTEVNNVGEANSPRLKVRILREGRKTPYDITKEIKIENKENKNRNENIKNGINEITGSVVYEGKSILAERTGIYFFSGLMTTLGLYSFFRGRKIWT